MSKFNVGDRVRTLERLMYLPPNITGVIVRKESDGRYKVQIDEEEDMCAFYFPAQLELVKAYNHKTAFLTELKDLLAKYDARISLYAKGSYCGDDIESVTMSISVGNECIDYTIKDFFDTDISADNIMDYDKE